MYRLIAGATGQPTRVHRMFSLSVLPLLLARNAGRCQGAGGEMRKEKGSLDEV